MHSYRGQLELYLFYVGVISRMVNYSFSRATRIASPLERPQTSVYTFQTIMYTFWAIYVVW